MAVFRLLGRFGAYDDDSRRRYGMVSREGESSCPGCRFMTAEHKEEHNKRSSEEEPTATRPKSKSRLAMMAEDWLEDEEDELELYWNKFEESKTSGITTTRKEDTATSSASSNNANEHTKEKENNMTTQELLDRYLQSRGIDRTSEQEQVENIEQAIQRAKRARTAVEACQILEQVRSALQYQTRLGGQALLLLAHAYMALVEDDEDEMTKNGKEQALDICEGLALSPHKDIQRDVKDLLQNGSSLDRWNSQADLWSQWLDPKLWWEKV